MGIFNTSSSRDHYQQGEGWGSKKYKFGRPMNVSFQPQPDWGGREFYSAHSGDVDSSMYDHAWDSTRRHGANGVGIREAKHYHRKAYAIEGELSRMMPEEIGHAAAYEIYRIWKHQGSLRDPMSASERKAEALVGMAVAESKRLLEYTGQRWAGNALYVVGDAAAATASLIYEQAIEDYGGDLSRGRHGARSRRSSMSNYAQPPVMPYGSYQDPGSTFGSRHAPTGYAPSGSSYASSEYDDPYAIDDFDDYRGRDRSRSRHGRSSSRNGRSSSRYGGGRSRSRGPSVVYPGAIPSGAAPIQMPMGSGFPYGETSSAYGAVGGVPYASSASSAYPTAYAPAAPGYAVGGGAYPQSGYAGSGGGYSQAGYPVQGQQPMVIVEPSRRSHKHSHSSSSRYRSRPRSVDPAYRY